MTKNNFIISILFIAVAASTVCAAPRVEPIRFGNFDSWVEREIKESIIIGGKEKTLWAVGPTAIIKGNKAYVPQGGSPWATSNVYARVSGVTKGSNAVYPYDRGGGQGKAAMLCSQMETVKALGIIKMDVMVAGSMFLGRMFEPITSTENPYTKMEVGVPFTHRPDAFIIDYKVDLPATNTRVRSSGFGHKTTMQGRDTPVIFVLLQRRWEDAEGNLHAKRVATGGQIFTEATDWVNGHKIPLVYGDVSANPDLKWLGLRKANAYYARNSKGELRPVIEEGFDTADATPTHAVVMISSGNGEPYVATPGVTFYVDNAGFYYKE